jgi:hypothetical protein
MKKAPVNMPKAARKGLKRAARKSKKDFPKIAGSAVEKRKKQADNRRAAPGKQSLEKVLYVAGSNPELY